MSEMYKSVSFFGAINERTGYGVHASRFCEALEKIMPVRRNQLGGEINLTLIDVVSIQNINERLPYPSILYSVWESTEYPQWFIDRLKYFDQLWVPAEWQRAASIAQGIPEEFVKVVPEGVDPEVYKPTNRELNPFVNRDKVFDFLHVGQWQPRKSTLEIIQAFLKAFPNDGHNGLVRLYLSVDTLFPSDEFKSTEERLAHHGINDPRIIPIHFEEREDYIRRLQNAHCFVSCARSEGWGLPIIEAMACGIPTIVADWSGSTEYAYNAIKIPIRKLIKPYGIYGNWDVPGQWCEPDFDKLAEEMKRVFNFYSEAKEQALKNSDEIRTKFSWDAAAKKAYDIIQAIPEANANTMAEPVQDTETDEETIRKFARKYGFEIQSMSKRNAIFCVDSHCDTPEKLGCLIETITQIKSLGYPLLLSSHLPLPEHVISMADFYIYDKRDILSGDDRATYWRTLPDGKVETTKSGKPCHALAGHMNARNEIDFCLGKYDWIYHMCFDTECDLKEWLAKVNASDKPLIGVRWDHQEKTFGGQLIAAKTEIMDKMFSHLTTWDEYVKEFGDKRFNSEEGMLDRVNQILGDNYDIIDMELGNRFDQVDREAWKDDQFICHFVDGPYLQIVGISNREYDVVYSNPVDGAFYGLKQKPGMWSKPDKKYFRAWTIRAELNGEVKFEHTLNLKGQNVLISSGSKALGDTLAWVPYVEEFRKKHECNVYLSTWWNNILDYPEIHFMKPGEMVENVYASYTVGCFDDQKDMNAFNWRTSNLQQVSADILGIDYVPLRAKLKYEPYKPKGNGNPPKPYICFSEFSTMRNKLWNREGAWQEVIDYLNEDGYDCVSISAEQSRLKGIVDHCGQSIEQTLTDVSGARFYIGLNAGPTWIAYSLGIPVVMIDGVSEPWNNPPNPYRVSVDVCRPGCFNDPSLPISRDWEWCPRKKDYACTREITPEMVINMIKEVSNASGIKEAKENDGDCRARTRGIVQTEQGSHEYEQAADA